MAITLLNCDCMEYMATLPDKDFDLAITSPPYNMNLRVNAKGDGYCSRQIVKELSTKYANYADNMSMNDYRAFLVRIMRELVRVSDLTFFNVQMITGNKPALCSAIGEMAEHVKEVIIWDKGHGQPAIGNGVLNSCFEFVIVLGGNPITRAFNSANFERGKMDNILRIRKSRPTGINHKAAYPIELPQTILANFARPGVRYLTRSWALAQLLLQRTTVALTLWAVNLTKITTSQPRNGLNSKPHNWRMPLTQKSRALISVRLFTGLPWPDKPRYIEEIKK